MSYLNKIKEVLKETLARPEFNVKVCADGSAWLSSKHEDLGLFVTLNNRFRNEMGLDSDLSFDKLVNNRRNIQVYVTSTSIYKFFKRKKCFVRAKALEHAKYLYRVEYNRIRCLIGGSQPVSNAHGNILKFICDDINYNERRLIATGARLLTGPSSQIMFKTHNRNAGASQFLESKVLNSNTISVRIKPSDQSEKIYHQLMAVFSSMEKVTSIMGSMNSKMFILEIAGAPKPKVDTDIGVLVINSDYTKPSPKPEKFEDSIVNQLKTELRDLDLLIESKKVVFNKAKIELQELVVRRDRASEAINVLIGK